MAENRRASSLVDKLGFTRKLSLGTLITVVFVACILLSIRTPFGDKLVSVGKVGIGFAVVNAGDMYLLSIVAGLVLYHKQIWLYKSTEFLLIYSLIVALFISSIVNGIDAASVVELVQWIEMAVLLGVVSVLLSSNRQRERVLKAFVYFSGAKALWTLLYFVQFGYPGRRFDAFPEGVALVIAICFLLERGYQPRLIGLTSILLMSVVVSQERKVWISIGVALSITILFYLVKLDADRLPRTLSKMGIIIFSIVTVVGLLAPGEIITRLQSLALILPWTEGQGSIERIYLWETGIRMVSDRPVLGVGPGNWFDAKSMYGSESLQAFEEKTNSDLGPHSLVLKILAEGGILGSILLLLLLLQPLRIFGRYLATPHPVSLAIGGAFVYVVSVASLRAGGFPLRSVLFLMYGLYLSYNY